MHSNRSLSFTVANVRDLSSAATLSIQLAGETNAETDAWRAAIQSVLDAVQGTASWSQQQVAVVQAPAPSPAALRWQAFHAAAKKWIVRPPPSRATLNIRLDKVLIGLIPGLDREMQTLSFHTSPFDTGNDFLLCADMLFLT